MTVESAALSAWLGLGLGMGLGLRVGSGLWLGLGLGLGLERRAERHRDGGKREGVRLARTHRGCAQAVAGSTHREAARDWVFALDGVERGGAKVGDDQPGEHLVRGRVEVRVGVGVGVGVGVRVRAAR